MENKKLIEKLSNIQNELKAPKGQFNSFGKYKYRSCEDILEALKPICKKYRTTLALSDELVVLGTHTPTPYTENVWDKDAKQFKEETRFSGSQRFYIKATATLYDLDDGESNNKIEATAYAREEETKKGMDGSQITGTASSYARKYALNGLFNIDDTKDADTDEFQSKTQGEPKNKSETIEEINIDAKLGFGKYKEKTWTELYFEDEEYFNWLIDNAKTKEGTEVYKKIYSEIQKRENEILKGEK